MDDDDDLEEIRREAEQRRQQANAPRRPQQRVPAPLQPPAPVFGPGFGRLGGLMQQAMNAGFGPMQMGGRASAAMFRQDLQAFSTIIHETSEGRMDRMHGGRQNVMFGGSSTAFA
jgi:hypothetical protein